MKIGDRGWYHRYLLFLKKTMLLCTNLQSIFNPIGYQMETECTLMIISNKATNTPSSGLTRGNDDTRQRWFDTWYLTILSLASPLFLANANSYSSNALHPGSHCCVFWIFFYLRAPKWAKFQNFEQPSIYINIDGATAIIYCCCTHDIYNLH